MTARSVAGSLLALAALSAAAVAPAAAQDAQRRSLYVSVVTDQGAPVADLGPADFIVREDNVAREVLAVGPADAPMQIALLVDNSTAASTAIQDIRLAVEEFVARMTAPAAGGKNQIAIIGIADRPTILADYTSNPAQLKKGIGRIFAQPESGMYLLDALYETAQGFLKRGADRPVIVSITTEGPELSNRMHDQVMDAVQNVGASYVAVTIGPPANIAFSNELRERALVFDQVTAATGGWLDNPLTSIALRMTLNRLADQLTHEYRVTYARPESLIPPEHITVAVKRPGLTAHGAPVKTPGDQKP